MPDVAERYNVSPRTVRNWGANPTLEFPPAKYFNGRRYYSLAELEQWERTQAARKAPLRVVGLPAAAPEQKMPRLKMRRPTRRRP